MTFRPLPVLTLLSVLSLALLVWLGNWQYGKFRSKLSADAQAPAWQTVSGTVIGDSDVLLYAYADGVSGWQRLVAIDTGDSVIWTAVELIEDINAPHLKPLSAPGARLAFSARGLETAPSGRSVLGGADAPLARVYQTFDAQRLGAHLPGTDRARLSPASFSRTPFVSGATAVPLTVPIRWRARARMPVCRRSAISVTP